MSGNDGNIITDDDKLNGRWLLLIMDLNKWIKNYYY